MINSYRSNTFNNVHKNSFKTVLTVLFLFTIILVYFIETKHHISRHITFENISFYYYDKLGDRKNKHDNTLSNNNNTDTLTIFDSYADTTDATTITEDTDTKRTKKENQEEVDTIVYDYTNPIDLKTKPSYHPNIEILHLIAELWKYRLLHDETNYSNVYKRWNKQLGNLLQRKKQLLLWNSLSYIVNILPNSTICEIGFAFGFSSIVILESNPSVKYVGFDLYGQYPWSILKNIYGS